MRLLLFINKIMQWLGVDLPPSPYSDVANAGTPPADLQRELHRYTAILRASLVNIFYNCLFVDISKWQGEVDFLRLKSKGVKAVIMKCGQGTLLDPKVIENYRKAFEAGLKRGLYWFYDSRIEPKRQAAIFADFLKTYGYCELPCFLDYEENYGGSWAGIHHFTEFLLEFQKLSGLPNNKIGVYTGYFYWVQHGTTDPFWSQYWLWIAWYGNVLDVILPNPWNQDKLFGWQYTDQGDGKGFGVSSFELDMNWFVKGLVIFEAMYGETGEVPPSTGVEGMYKVWSESYTMSLRSGASASASRINSYPSRTIFICDIIDLPPASGGLPSDKWAHVVSVNGVAVNGYVAQVHNGVVHCIAEPISQEGEAPHVSVQFTDAQGVVWTANDIEMRRG